jgi:tetratricopeptide (TPR) repeat protein
VPRIGVRHRWLVPALTGAVILAGVACGGVWWSKSDHRPSPLEQGMAAYDHQDWPAAERKAREQLRKDREDPDALRLLGRAFYRQRRDQAAAAIFERLRPDTMAAEDYLLVGQACLRSRKVDLAINVWRMAVQLDPTHFESRIALEQVFFRLDKLSDAEREVESLLAQPGRDALAEFLRGQIRTQQADPAGAARAFERALERPDQWKFMVETSLVRKQLARCLLQTGQPALAREQVRQLTGQDRDQETCWLLSRCDLQEAIPTEADVLAQARSYRELHPTEPEPSPFVGELRCIACHPRTFRDQNASRHARTFFRKDKLPAIPFPQGPITDPGDHRVSHAFIKRSGGVEVESRVDGELYKTILNYAFGSGDRGLTLVGQDPKGRSLEFRLSLYPEHVGWDVTTGQSVQPTEKIDLYQGLVLSADNLRQCIGCHTTNPHAILTKTGLESSDRAIGCERCHGPGGNHVKAASQADFAIHPDPDLAIARASLASGSAIVALCAECHSQRKSGAVLKPGSPDAVRFQATTLTWSRCYTQSDQEFDCMTCHDPHRDVEISAAWYESKCLQCHTSAPSKIGKASAAVNTEDARTKTSCPIQPTTGCIECHMPKLATPMAHSRFTDHFIRANPRLESSRKP